MSKGTTWISFGQQQTFEETLDIEEGVPTCLEVDITLIKKTMHLFIVLQK